MRSDCGIHVLRENDVFNFSYNDEARKNIFMSDHCFDGQLVFKDGMLFDTYWGFDPRGDSGRRFTPDEANRLGTLTFICNLEGVEKIAEHLYPQYADGDAFNLSYQHGCYKYFVKRNGAKRSVEKQLTIIEERIKKAKQDAEYTMRAAFNEIERGHEQAVRLAAGEDITV